MIEIPDLDSLPVNATDSKRVYGGSGIQEDGDGPPAPPQPSHQLYSASGSTDEYIHDLKAYRFGESSGYLSDRPLSQGASKNVTNGDVLEPPIDFKNIETPPSPALSHGHYYNDSSSFFEGESRLASQDSISAEYSVAQVASIRTPTLVESPLLNLQQQQEAVQNSSPQQSTNRDLLKQEQEILRVYRQEQLQRQQQQQQQQQQIDDEDEEMLNVQNQNYNPQEEDELQEQLHDQLQDLNLRSSHQQPELQHDQYVPQQPEGEVKTLFQQQPQGQELQPGVELTNETISGDVSATGAPIRQVISVAAPINAGSASKATTRKDLATDSKTPAEYTLHILFTQFVRHAERKLNLCLDYPLNDEPPIIDLLAEGVDPQFDRIVASLGYISRRKPSPVIDSVMFWRKSKSEVATMAAQEVEKVVQQARQLPPPPQPPYSGGDYGGYTLNAAAMKNGAGGASNGAHVNGRAKRSLSLMRNRSISKLTGSHRRNQSASSVLGPKSSNPTPITSINNYDSNNDSYDEYRKSLEGQMHQARETAIQADRKSLASIYILCRVLIEVVRQTPSSVMGDDLGGKLEEIVYTQLKTTDPISTSESLVRSSNWNLFAQLLGFMSEKRFLSVSDRFIADLEKVPAHIINQNDEPRLHLLIHGMKYLKLTNYPLEKFEESAEFMQSLGKFFSKAMNESVIFAYCDVLSNLILPLASVLTAETNHPTWVEAIEMIFKKGMNLLSQSCGSVGSTSGTGPALVSPGSVGATTTSNASFNGDTSSINWTYSLLLVTSVLSVSTKELFSQEWLSLIEQNIFKLKPKVPIQDKTTLLVCVTRLTWVYLYRLPDSLNNTIKKLDSLFLSLFFGPNANSKKQQWMTSDKAMINALISLIKNVGYQHLNYVLDNVLLRLLKLSFVGTLENSSIEKLILVVKAYLEVIQGYEAGEKPAFPTDEVLTSLLVGGDALKKAKSNKKNNITATAVKNTATVSTDFMFLAKKPNNALTHEEICKNFATLIKLLDARYGADVLLPESSASGSTTPSVLPTKSQTNFFHFGIDFSDQAAKQSHMELFATLIEAIPWTLVPLGAGSEDSSTSLSGMPFKNVVEILARNAVHPDYLVARAATKSLRNLASRKNPSSLVTIFAKIAFQFTEKPGSYNSVFLNSPEFHRLLKIYVDLLNCWLEQFRERSRGQASTTTATGIGGGGIGPETPQDDEMMNKDVLNDLYQINYKTDGMNINPTAKAKTSDELEWKNIITVIEEIEGNGLFFLCSQDPKTRHFGIFVLKIVEQFDRAIYVATDPKSEIVTHSRSSSKFAADIGTRLIHVLEDMDFLELIKPLRNELSGPERSRLSKLKHKKHILVKLGESDYGIDSTLWFRLFPRLLDIFFERCPMPVAMCRSIVCVRMVQMHEYVLDFANTNKNNTSSLFTRAASTQGGPPEVLVDQWKLYLIFAACSLTSTNEQKISFPSQPTHGRKKSMPMYIQHQKITSAKSIFRMVFPLLKSKQPMVRDSVITGLSCININIFKTLLENVPASVSDWEVENIGKKRDNAEDQLRVEVVHILSNITSKFQANIEEIYEDEWTVANLVAIIKQVKTFLNHPVVQVDIEFQKLRRYFSVFLGNVFEGIQAVRDDLNKWLPFEARLGCFNYLKEWCGYGDGAMELAEDRYSLMTKKSKDVATSSATAAILEVERKALQFACLNCMAKLCSGSIKHQIEVASGPYMSGGMGTLAVLSFDIPALQSWIHGLFCTDSDKIHEIGRIALSHILRGSKDEEMYAEVFKQCYTDQKSVRTTESYFTVFVDAFMESQEQKQIDNSTFTSPPYDVLCLSTFLVGSESYSVRHSAIQLLISLEQKYYGRVISDRYTECVCNKTKVVYKKALFDISATLAAEHPEGVFVRISYLTMFFNLVGNSSRRDILSCLLPWIQTVELKEIVGSEIAEPKVVNSEDDNNPPPLDSSSMMVLNNLFEITVKFSSVISNEVEALWVALGSNARNFDKIVQYIMSNCLERKNAMVVEFSRQIIDYLSFSQPDPSYIVDKLIGNLNPRAMVPPQPYKMKTAATINTTVVDSIEYPYTANIWDIIPNNEKDVAFSLGQLSLVFLVDLFTTQSELMRERLPLLLHVSFALLDHYLFLVQEQAGMLLIHLIHALAPNEPKSRETIEILRQRDHLKHLWVYDDLNSEKRGVGARTPKNMDLLVRNVLEIFSRVGLGTGSGGASIEAGNEESGESTIITPTASTTGASAAGTTGAAVDGADISLEKHVATLQEEWSRVSLNWATTCAVRHLACRSFQIFRSLLSFLDQGMLKDMLHRLSNTISDDTVEIQGFAMQILMTLNAITAELNPKKLIDFPQLFWSSVACLSTIHEQEFIEVLSTMSKFVSKIDLDSPDTVSCLISTFPPKWEGKFEGLQQIVMVGLRSATAWDPLLKFLDKMNQLKDSEIIGMGDSRLLMAVLANMPRFLHALDIKTITPEIEETAMLLSSMADNCQKPGLSKILISLSKNRFRSKKDFLNQTISTMKQSFFPEFEAQTLVFLLGLLSNKIRWVKLETMNMLKHIFPLVDLQRDEFLGVGADLISPLLRLLLTDYAEPALEVLDEAVIISGSQLDKDVLRMSLGNTSVKKDYEKTATLFGIPDESGWAIPMPAVTASSTRNNVHAVFSTCAVGNNNDVSLDDIKEAEVEEEMIHFHMEDYYAPMYNDHYDGESVTVGEPDASLSNMWAALDEFDSFLTKEDNHPRHHHYDNNQYNSAINGGGNLQSQREFGHHLHSASVDTKYSSASDSNAAIGMDSAPLVYDKKVSVILNRSLARTQSNTSFKSSFADSIGGGQHTASPSTFSPLGGGSVIANKRSYIPFRNSRTIVSANNSNAVNNGSYGSDMPLSPTFDPDVNVGPLSPYRTPRIGSPVAMGTPLKSAGGGSVMASPPSAGMQGSAGTSSSNHGNGSNPVLGGLDLINSPFDSILGSGGKKKIKRGSKFSPNASSTSISPELAHWTQGVSMNSSSTPPGSTKGKKKKKKP